ncbi:MAG: V-type ATPase subunit [candidate division WOR-3 bacterium]
MVSDLRLNDDPDYGFAIGRVRARERELLGSSEYELLVRAADASGFLAALLETSYSSYFGQDRATEGIEPKLARALEENDSFFTKHCEKSWLLDFVRLRTDCLNLKVLAKRRSSGAELESQPLARTGTISREALRQIVEAPDRAEPRWAAEAWARATDTRDGQHAPSTIDAIFDRACYKEQLRVVRRSEFLSGYLGLCADVENIRTLIRVRVLGEGREMLKVAFVDGGTVHEEELAALVETEWAEVAAHFGSGRFRDYVAAAIAGLERARSLRTMERIGRELKLAYLRRSRYAVFGHEPLVTFYLLRENEVTNIRLLWAAKIVGLPENEARELVAYVA